VTVSISNSTSTSGNWSWRATFFLKLRWQHIGSDISKPFGAGFPIQLLISIYCRTGGPR
jgi:hypothetical protein